MISRLLAALILSSVLLGGTAPVFSQGASNQQELRDACMSDYRRFCFGVMPGGGRILSCLNEHTKDLSPQCGIVVAVGMQCAADYKKFCPDASAQNGELKSCMQQNVSQLSPGCAKVMSANAAQ